MYHASNIIALVGYVSCNASRLDFCFTHKYVDGHTLVHASVQRPMQKDYFHSKLVFSDNLVVVSSIRNAECMNNLNQTIFTIKSTPPRLLHTLTYSLIFYSIHMLSE